MPKFLPLLFEPFSNRQLVYGQYQFAVIGRIPFHFENIIFDVKLPSVFFGINPAVAPDSFFLGQKAFYHFFGETDGSAQLFHSQHLPEHRKRFSGFSVGNNQFLPRSASGYAKVLWATHMGGDE